MSNSYFNHNRNLQIHGDVTFVASGGPTDDDRSFFHVSHRVQATNAQARTLKRGFKLLCDNTAPSARYGCGQSFTGPRCHPGTRIAVQDHIFKWLDDPDGTIAMWMNGPVGIGKSAIAQTVAHLAAERGQLSSAFFFFRSDETRNSAKYLVPTLAYEMTQQMPHTLDHVCQTIAINPLILSSPLEHQINTTIFQALDSPSKSPPRGRRLIIIDGLDECLNTHTQQTIVWSFISSLLALSRKIIPHRILIVSRPESHIASAFSANDISQHVKSFALGSWNTEDDIEIFLRAKLDEIKQIHPLRHYLPDVWPDYDSFRSLRERSVGSFAYANVAVRHLVSHNNHPEHALKDILSLRQNRAAATFANLDTLYRHILQNLDPDMCFTLQNVLCLFLYCSEREIQSLATRLSEDESAVELALIRASSLIRIDNSGADIDLHHSSFGEFLRDKERSRDLYVFSADVANAVAAALSNLWLHPMPSVEEYGWFMKVGLCIWDTNYMDMTVHVLATLAATNIPVSFLSDQIISQKYDINSVGYFFHAIRTKSQEDLDSTYGPLYNQAFNAICAWLRSHFNLFVEGASTGKHVLDIILENLQNADGIASNERPSFIIFRRLAHKSAFPCTFRIFPEMDHLEIYSCILERYLALESGIRKKDMARHNKPLNRTITLTELYLDVFKCHDAMVPDFCQRLEQIVLAGQKALGPVASLYMTSIDCIFRVFYGDECYLDSKYQLAVRKKTVLDCYMICLDLAERTDHHIRQAHAGQDFAYISGDIEALYCSRPKPFYRTLAV